MDLNTLALEYGTDKSSRHHNYMPVYQKLFSEIRETTRGILEIGIGGITYKGQAGSSLRVWQDYFPNAEIVGLDIDATTKAEYGPRIHVIIGDQTSKSAISAALSRMPTLDIVIDDGSHENKLTIASFEYIFQFLQPGGLYIIEDTLCTDELKFKNTKYEMDIFILKLIHSIETNGRLVSRSNSSDFKKVSSDIVMNYLERWIESIHIHRGLYIIRKRNA